jgi:DnaK suppressor protein
MTTANSDGRSGLTKGELELLRERLERTRAEVLGRVQGEQAVAREAEGFFEAMEAAEQTREQDDAVLMNERDRELLHEIDHALAKFASGSYGLSESSGEPIGFRRLLSVPWTRVGIDEEEKTTR